MILRELVMGLDIGTTSVKAIIFNKEGTLIAESEEQITTNHPHEAWKEQDPEQIERLSVQAIKHANEKAKLQPKELLSVGFSCAMHSLICVDKEGEPISPMLIWSDGRSGEQVNQLRQSSGNSIYMKTGTPIHPMTPLAKLMWMKDVGYKPYQQAAYFMTMKEYLIQKWFGQHMVDYSMASSTGLMNVHTLNWDEEALTFAGVDRDQLGNIVPPTEVLPALKKEIAEEMGVVRDVPFVIGAADGQLANLGSGAITPGEVNVSVGTSGAIRQFTDGSPVQEQMDTFTYAFTENTSVIGGATNNGGIALQWVKDLIGFEGSFGELTASAEKVGIGADGLLFLPYVNGERAPIWNQHARGNFYGLSLNHKKEHLIRAVLEGITFNIYQISKALEQETGRAEKISVNGGLSKSDLWVQMLADVFGSPIHVSETHHNAAWGAAWTALTGIGAVSSFAAIKENLPGESVIYPDMKIHEKYMEVYKKYELLAGRMVDLFAFLVE